MCLYGQRVAAELARGLAGFDINAFAGGVMGERFHEEVMHARASLELGWTWGVGLGERMKVIETS